MHQWHDWLTQTTYKMDEATVSAIRRHVAARLAASLQRPEPSAESGDLTTAGGSRLKHLADEVARFWSDEYPKLLFPLRVAAHVEHPQEAFAQVLEAQAAPVRLPAQGSWRSAYLEPALPPILPASGPGAGETLLASEWALAASTFALCAWPGRHGYDGAAGETSPDDDLSALRLALLLFPLWEALPAAGGVLAGIAAHPRIAETVHALNDPFATAPGARGEILSALRRTDALPEWVHQERARIVVGGAQRIKQYVFESPRLQQIRGGSILVEHVLAAAAETVAAEVGPECVVRKAGGTLSFVVPSASSPGRNGWEERIAAFFHRHTGTARFAAGSAEVPLAALLPRPPEDASFRRSHGAAYDAQNRSRDQADDPRWEALPFEERCEHCGERAAEYVERSPEGEPWHLCAVCRQRLQVGQYERKRLIQQVWAEVGVRARDWVHAGDDPLPPSLEELVPEGRRRRWIAMVYGDGNNFGGIIQRLKTLPEQLHWTRRLYWTVRGLTEMALVGATATYAEAGQKVAGRNGPSIPPGVRARLRYHPFEILAIGGDDVAFFAWAPVGLKAVERLQAGLEKEFQPGAGPPAGGDGPVDPPRVTFSFGTVIADHHTPVRRLRDVAEEVLLKKVKAMRDPADPRGRVAFFVATNSSEATASRVERLWRLKRQAKDESSGFILSVQPLTAEQLAFLLDKAAGLTSEVGRLSRLTTPFAQAELEVALLNYRYIRARTREKGQKPRQGPDVFSLVEDPVTSGADWSLFPGGGPPPVFPLFRRTVSGSGEGVSTKQAWPEVPLLDLLQLVKVLQ